MRIIKQHKEAITTCTRCNTTMAFIRNDVEDLRDKNGVLLESQITCPGCGLIISVKNMRLPWKN